MAALSLYINTFRIVLEVSTEEESSWAHIYGSLSCLRKSLLCCVCENLLMIPMRSIIGHCQHFVCKNCLGKEMKMNPPCVHCADFSKFVENSQLRIVLQCFKKMCLYISCCSFFRNFNHAEMSSPKLKFLSMVNEGAIYNDESYPNIIVKNISDNQLTLLSNNGEYARSRRTVYSIKVNRNESKKLTIRKKTYKTSEELAEEINAEVSNSRNTDVDEKSVVEMNEVEREKVGDEVNYVDSDSTDSSNFMKECLQSFRKRSHCRCGMATRNPGKLTCCGQRCPCYVAGRSCLNCHCRGCRNPQKLVVTHPTSHNLLIDREATPSNTKELSDSSESSDETSSSDSSDDELRIESHVERM